MPIFKSKKPDIDLPSDITIWDYLFNSSASPFSNPQFSSQLAGYVDAASKERVNWRQVKEASTLISTALVKDYGFREGDTLSLFSSNTIWYPVVMFGGLRAGGKISGASPAYNVEEMTYALKTARAKYLATSSASISVAAQAAANASIPKSRIFLLSGQLQGYTTIQDLISAGRAYGRDQVLAFELPAGKKNKDVCAFLSFSSGTTGLPKAVMISHQNAIAQCLQIQQLTPESHKKVLAVLPLFHITGLVHALQLPVLVNAEVIMLPTFSMDSMLKAVCDYQIEELLLVPPIIIRLVRDPIVEKYDLRCVKRFSSGAAPLSAEVLALLEKKFPGTAFKQGYGMTESCSCITAHPPEYYGYKHALAVGTIVASTSVRILKEDGSDGGIGEAGEILAKGPQCVMGYLDNEKATQETFDSEGWLHTGDQGYIDDQGLLYITDRIKEMVKVKGISVAPAELEDLLLGHEKVEDVAVMGVPDDRAGEVPKAFVVLKMEVVNQGRDAVESVGRELIAFVRKNKVRHKWVREVEIVQEIPKSASGKILRRVLKERVRQGKKGIVVRAEEELRAKL